MVINQKAVFCNLNWFVSLTWQKLLLLNLSVYNQMFFYVNVFSHWVKILYQNRRNCKQFQHDVVQLKFAFQLLFTLQIGQFKFVEHVQNFFMKQIGSAKGRVHTFIRVSMVVLFQDKLLAIVGLFNLRLFNRLQPLRVQTKVIIRKSCCEHFFWNRDWDLGWFWAGWQYWKKNWADYEQILRAVVWSFRITYLPLICYSVIYLLHCIPWEPEKLRSVVGTPLLTIE